MSGQEGRTPRQDNQEAITRRNTRAMEPDEPHQDRLEASQIFSPTKQKSSDTSRLTPAEEKKIADLIQPEEREGYDINLFAKRALRGLKALELKKELTEGSNVWKARGRQHP